MRHHFEIIADHFQVLLHDEESDGIGHTDWIRWKVPRRLLLAVADGAIGVGTFRNRKVPVDVEVLDAAPDDLLDAWDFVTECGIETTGRLAIRGCTEYLPDAARLVIPAGTYRARVYYGGLATVSPNRFEGSDRYKIALWPGQPVAASLLKGG